MNSSRDRPAPVSLPKPALQPPLLFLHQTLSRSNFYTTSVARLLLRFCLPNRAGLPILAAIQNLVNLMKTACAFLCLGATAVVCLVPTRSSADIRTTAYGAGADVELREHTDSGANTPAMNTRTSSSGDRNEVIALRFDLSGYTLSDLTGVTLSVINFRNDSSTRKVALYGVHPDALPPTGSFTVDTWDETTVKFSTMPGLLAPDGNFLTQSLNLDKLTPLGQISYHPNSEGLPEVFSDPALTTFIQTYSGGNLVTFLLAQATDYSTTGQARIASKEATALNSSDPLDDYAPYLTFSVVPEPGAAALFGAGLGLLVAFRRSRQP